MYAVYSSVVTNTVNDIMVGVFRLHCFIVYCLSAQVNQIFMYGIRYYRNKKVAAAAIKNKFEHLASLFISKFVIVFDQFFKKQLSLLSKVQKHLNIYKVLFCYQSSTWFLIFNSMYNCIPANAKRYLYLLSWR